MRPCCGCPASGSPAPGASSPPGGWGPSPSRGSRGWGWCSSGPSTSSPAPAGCCEGLRVREDGILRHLAGPGAPRPGPGPAPEQLSLFDARRLGGCHHDAGPRSAITYDGSFAGFLTCVFESYVHHEERRSASPPARTRASPSGPSGGGHPTGTRRERVYRSLASQHLPGRPAAGDPRLSHLPARAGTAACTAFLRLGYQRGPGRRSGTSPTTGSTAVDQAVRHLNERGPPAQGLCPLLRPGGGAGGGDRAQKPGAAPAPAPLLRPVLRGALPHLRPHPPGGSLIYQPGRWAIRARWRTLPPGRRRGRRSVDLPASVAAVL